MDCTDICYDTRIPLAPEGNGNTDCFKVPCHWGGHSTPSTSVKHCPIIGLFFVLTSPFSTVRCASTIVEIWLLK